jgi:GcrA cell cycle regulator
MATPTKNWKNGELEHASVLWSRGFSYFEIATALGPTYNRNMIASQAKSHRNMFPPRDNGRPLGRVTKIKPEPKPRMRKIKPEPFLPPVEKYRVVELDEYERARLPGLTLVENDGCKWPLTDVGPFRFCGCSQVEGKPWCAHHQKKAFYPRKAA